MRVLITGGGSGGHISPALALARFLREQEPEVSLLYVGGKLTMEGSAGPSLEETAVRPTGIPFVALPSGKLTRGRWSFSTLRRLWGVIPGLWQAVQVVRRFQPDVVFSSGGYVSVPVVVAAWLCRVPIVVHEQTAAVGLANKLAGYLAAKVAITFPQSAQYFPAAKVVETGNPLRSEVLHPDLELLRTSPFGRWLTQVKEPLLYVTGGGLGSHVINVAVEGCLEQLLQRYRIVHQCGDHTGYGDYDRLRSRRQQLRPMLQDRYWPVTHLSPAEVGLVYREADLVVARAGANTVLELAAWGLPSIFIPIPWVTHDEQTRNAEVLVEAGTAVILPERALTAERLMAEIVASMDRLDVMRQAGDRARRIVRRDAAERLARIVIAVARRVPYDAEL